MVEVHSDAPHDAGCRIWLKPNQALTRGQLKFFFLIIATGSLLFASWFAWHGYWVPLPFAGLELAFLWWCLDRIWRRHRDQAELIEVEPAVTRLRGRRPDRDELFQTGWLHVELRRDRRRWYPRRLLLRSHGREVQIGAFLNENERQQAAETLRDALRPMTAWNRRD